jgi:hypothetical protein
VHAPPSRNRPRRHDYIAYYKAVRLLRQWRQEGSAPVGGRAHDSGGSGSGSGGGGRRPFHPRPSGEPTASDYSMQQQFDYLQQQLYHSQQQRPSESLLPPAHPTAVQLHDWGLPVIEPVAEPPAALAQTSPHSWLQPGGHAQQLPAGLHQQPPALPQALLQAVGLAGGGGGGGAGAGGLGLLETLLLQQLIQQRVR